MENENLPPQNLESYSTEALANFARTVEEFSELLNTIKSEDANIGLFNSIYVTVEGRKRRLGDISNVETGDNPLKLKLMIYNKEHIEIILETIKESGFPAKHDEGSQYINVRVPKPTRMQLEEIADDLIRRTNGMSSRMMKVKTNTNLRIRAAVQNEFIENKIATIANKIIESSYERYIKEIRVIGLLKRKQILGSFYKSIEKDDDALIKDVNLLIKFNKKIEGISLSENIDTNDDITQKESENANININNQESV